MTLLHVLLRCRQYTPRFMCTSEWKTCPPLVNPPSLWTPLHVLLRCRQYTPRFMRASVWKARPPLVNLPNERLCTYYYGAGSILHGLRACQYERRVHHWLTPPPMNASARIITVQAVYSTVYARVSMKGACDSGNVSLLACKAGIANTSKWKYP